MEEDEVTPFPELDEDVRPGVKKEGEREAMSSD
jgi:hypothetical protein